MKPKENKLDHTVGPGADTLSPQELKEAIHEERVWLRENGATSAVTGGPVEDMEGVPLPADIHQGTPALTCDSP
ncbi:hypothetical protein K2X33_02555 [bacterium]|nr:hypothetical protein [bacterium]